MTSVFVGAETTQEHQCQKNRKIYIIWVICNTYMTLTKWRTTKIPEYYFSEIEEAMTSSPQYVSVSEFIRTAVEEKLSKIKTYKDFLLLKDLVFTEAKIIYIHEIVSTKFKMDSKHLLKKNMQQVIDESLDIDMINFLAKFMKNFAKFHPFKDGNKRTLLVAVDTFLRLNNLKLALKAKKVTETEDEIFFWQNSNQQRTNEQIKKFINSHLEKYISVNDVDKEIKNSINNNRLMLEKLSR